MKTTEHRQEHGRPGTQPKKNPVTDAKEVGLGKPAEENVVTGCPILPNATLTETSLSGRWKPAQLAQHSLPVTISYSLCRTTRAAHKLIRLINWFNDAIHDDKSLLLPLSIRLL
jgi:hypothetical protein